MLLCVVLFNSRQAPPAPATQPAASGSPAPKRPSLMNARAAQQQAEQQERLQVERDAVMARNAQAMTPELKSLMMKAKMQSRAPQYKKLFDSLQLDATTQTHLLDAIREREERIFDLQRKQRSEGMKGNKEFVRNADTEQLVTDKLFGLLVGDEKAAKIIELEAQMRGVAIKAASSLIE